MRSALAFVLSSSLATACGEEPGIPPFHFVDRTAESGLAAFRQVNGEAEKLMIVESVGGGVAFFDADLDGDLDAYLTNGSLLEGLVPGEEPRDALFLNDGSGRFVDGTAAAGLGDAHWTNGVIVADVDGDRAPDLYLTNYGPNVLYLNNGDGTFRDVTERAGVGDPSWSTGASFLDFDRDGDLDLYVANYVEFDEETMLRDRPTGTIQGQLGGAEDPRYAGVAVMKGPRGLDPARDRFYVNQGDGTFRDASVEVGIDVESKNFGFQTIVFDADGDGWLDVYVANDVLENLLWRNDQGKGFTNIGVESGLALSMAGTPQGGMGTCVGDYDGDLVPDVYVTNFVQDYSTLYRGSGGGTFMDRTASVKLNRSTWSLSGWACEFADFDSDGMLELFAGHAHVYPQVDRLELGTTYRQRNILYAQRGGDFVEPEGAGGPGFALVQATRGAALGDVDADGDLDLLFGNIDDAPALLVNQGPSGNWIKVRLVGAGGNTDAIGARLIARVGERRQLRLVGSGGGFLSSSDPRAHFGLGAAQRVDELEVLWPDGRRERFADLPAGRLYTIEEIPGEAGRIRSSTLR